MGDEGGDTVTSMKADPAETVTHVVKLVERDGVLGQIREVVKRVDTDHPDPAAIEELRALMRQEKWLAGFICDMADVTNTSIIRSMVSQTLAREALTAQATMMRDGLGQTDAPEIERGLIAHIVTCWLRLLKAEMVYQKAGTSEMTLGLANWHERRLTAAHGRYLRAVEGLARVRRLTRPGAVQINLGERQINVAGVIVGDLDKSDQSSSNGRA